MAPCKFYPFFVIVKTMVHPSINDNLYFIKTNFSIWSMYMYVKPTIIWVQFSSVNQSCPTLCDPMNHSNPSLPVHHQLLEFTKTHVHWVGDAIQPSRLMLSLSPPALNLSKYQGLFKWVSLSQQGAKVLEFRLQHQSFQWTPRTDLL